MDIFNSQYKIGEKIGDGNFAEVNVCECKKSGKKFAAKIIKKKMQTIFGNYDPLSRGMTSFEIEREVQILRSINHENVVKLHDMFEGNDVAILLLELVAGGELFARVAEFEKLPEQEASIFISQILKGVNHLHNLGIVHLDLKPENIMIQDIETRQIKIIDFGLARILNSNETIQDMAGTPEFCAPEIVNFDPITFATDMWAVGVMTYILLSGISPFAGDSQIETFRNILECTVQFDREEFSEVSINARDFINRLLRKNPRKRASASESMHHPWIEGVLNGGQPHIITKIDLQNCNLQPNQEILEINLKNTPEILLDSNNSINDCKTNEYNNVSLNGSLNSTLQTHNNQSMCNEPATTFLWNKSPKETRLDANGLQSKMPYATELAETIQKNLHIDENSSALENEGVKTLSAQSKILKNTNTPVKLNSIDPTKISSDNQTNSTVLKLQDKSANLKESKPLEVKVKNNPKFKPSEKLSHPIILPISGSKTNSGTLLERATKWIESKNQSIDAYAKRLPPLKPSAPSKLMSFQVARNAFAFSKTDRERKYPISKEDKKLHCISPSVSCNGIRLENHSKICHVNGNLI